MAEYYLIMERQRNDIGKYIKESLMYFYTYLLKCLVTGKVYYGKRTSKIPPMADFWNHYFTSSNVVKREINNHGLNSFQWEIRREFKTQYEMSRWESIVLRRLKVVTHPLFMNQHYTVGDFIPKSPTFKGHSHTKESKKQIALSVTESKSKKVYTRPDASVRNIETGFNKFWLGQKRPEISSKVSGGNNGRAKNVMTPQGRYATLKEAGKAYNVRWYTIANWINKGKEGFKYE